MNEAIIICRQASDALLEGNLLGQACAMCRRGLQVSLMADTVIRQGVIPLCNHCGFRLAEKLEREGRITEHVFTPQARAQLAKIIVEMASRN